VGSANQDATNEVILPSEGDGAVRGHPAGGLATDKGNGDEDYVRRMVQGAPHRLPVLRIGSAPPVGPGLPRCVSCALPLLGSALETLRDIVGLPDALGVHPCECGHPEMRRLPDGVFHCPACRSEVLPVDATSGIENLQTDRRCGAP
jgi:hypothetical protein